MLTIVSQVFYVLIALAMIVLILMQRGAGAGAGAGFGGGASATVFGARGSANFLTRSTAVLAGLFFLLTLGMGMFHAGPTVSVPVDDLGVMSGVAAPAVPVVSPEPVSGDVPAATQSAPVSAPPATSDVPAAADKPAAVEADKERKDGP